ncbi:MAG: phosphonate ABC transporter, permease protein PhnE [bacterium]
MKPILEKYPEIKKPKPSRWLIPSIIITIVILAWSMQDTEMAVLGKNRDGHLGLKFPNYRWDAAVNILLGIERPVYEIIDGNRVQATKIENGEEVPLTKRQGGLIRPDFSAKTMGILMPDLLETIEIALLGTLIAILIAFPLSFLAARNIIGSKPAGLAIFGIVRFLFDFLSAIPALVVALIFTTIVGVGPAAGVLALGFHSIGMIGRLFAEALENVDRGPIEALQATGAGWIQTIAYGVIPQIGPLFLAYSIYRWDINVRMSMILGFVGAGGIGVFLQQNINLFNYTQVSSSFIMILLTVTLIDLGSSFIQRKII